MGTAKTYYRCNKCGMAISDTEGMMCTAPMAVRTSGICGGSFTIEMTADEYNEQLKKWYSTNKPS